MGGTFGDILGSFGVDAARLPVVGSLFGPTDEMQANQAEMKKASAAYQAMRAPAAQAQADAMRNTMYGIAGPGNAMMGQVYGPGAMMDLQQATQNPVSQEMLGINGPTPPPQGGPAAGPGQIPQQYIDAWQGTYGIEGPPPPSQSPSPPPTGAAPGPAQFQNAWEATYGKA